MQNNQKNKDILEKRRLQVGTSPAAFLSPSITHESVCRSWISSIYQCYSVYRGRLAWSCESQEDSCGHLEEAEAASQLISPAPPSCRRRTVISQHNVKGASEVVGEGAAEAAIHERQEEGEQQQSQEQQPHRKSQSTHTLQQAGLLQQQQHPLAIMSRSVTISS